MHPQVYYLLFSKMARRQCAACKECCSCARNKNPWRVIQSLDIMSIYRPSNAIYQLLQQSQVSETPGSMAQGHHHATRFQLSQVYFPGRRAKSSVWMASMMAMVWTIRKRIQKRYFWKCLWGRWKAELKTHFKLKQYTKTEPIFWKNSSFYGVSCLWYLWLFFTDALFLTGIQIMCIRPLKLHQWLQPLTILRNGHGKISWCRWQSMWHVAKQWSGPGWHEVGEG